MVQVNFFMTIFLTIIMWGVYRFSLYKRDKKISIFREVVLLLFIVYFLILVFITVFKFGAVSFRNPFESFLYKEKGIFGIINIIPFKETISTILDGNVPINMPLRNIIGNILLFIPMGIAIPTLFEKYNKLSKIATLGFVSSLTIEVVQLFVGFNICDIDDIIFNTTGAIIGWVFYKILKKLISKTRINEIVDSSKDYETENIFRKSVKVLCLVCILFLVSYLYSFYNQTASSKLSDKELAKELFSRNIGSEFLQAQDLGDKKFYLVKQDDGLTVQSLEKYTKSRYANTYEGYGFYPSDNVGYSVGIINNYDEGQEKQTSTIAVFGKNSDANELIISLNGEEYKLNLKHNDYFLAVYPKYIDLDESIINNIYNGVKDDNLDIRFLDNNGNVMNDIEILYK